MEGPRGDLVDEADEAEGAEDGEVEPARALGGGDGELTLRRGDDEREEVDRDEDGSFPRL